MDGVIKESVYSVKITSFNAFRVLMVLIWTQNTVLNFVVEIIRRLPVVGIFSEYVIPALIVMTTVVALRWIFKHIRVQDLMFHLFSILIVIACIVLLPKNAIYIERDAWNILVLSIPMYFIGLAYNHEAIQKDLFWCSVFSVGTMILYQLFVLSTGRVLNSDNMAASYYTLPSIIYLIYWAFFNKKVKYWWLAAIGIFTSFVFGTRGPILAVLATVATGIVFLVIKQKSVIKRILSILGVVIAFMIVSSKEILMSVAKYLSGKFSELGFSTRIFDFLIEGNISYASGRDLITERILEAINQQPLLGYGVMGDRVVLNARVGEYAHNLILELWCSFGIIIGSVILIYLINLIYRAIKRADLSKRLFITFMVLMVGTKLMFSGSYIVEPYFFLTIGLCVNAARNREKRRFAHNEDCSN